MIKENSSLKPLKSSSGFKTRWSLGPVQALKWNSTKRSIKSWKNPSSKPRPRELFFRCPCGHPRFDPNGSKVRQIKTLNDDLLLKLPQGRCATCQAYHLLGGDVLPPYGNISQDLERTLLELVPFTPSYEALSVIVEKLRGIEVSPKEIELLVLKRGSQIEKLERQEYERLDEVVAQLNPSPVKRLYIGADGMYVHSQEEDSQSFEGKFGIVFTDEVAQVSQGRNLLLHKRYCASFRGKEDFGELLNTTAWKMGLERAEEVIFVSDGDRALWKIKEEHFPQAKGILDWNHISRRLTEALQLIEDEKLRERKREEISEFLWEGEVILALQRLESLISKEQRKPLSSDPARRLEALIEFKDYIANNEPWIINYGEAQEGGYYIGSSIMESTINHLASHRLKKKKGRSWIRDGADAVARIIVTLHNHEWDHIWKQIYTSSAMN